MSLARSLRRTSLLVRLRRAQTVAVCALLAVGCAWLVAFDLRVLVIVGLALAVAAAWPVDRARLARALDDANRLEGRVLAAYELARVATRTPFMEAALRDAEARSAGARGALPRGLPRWSQWLACVPLLVALGASRHQPKVTKPRDEVASARPSASEPTRAALLQELDQAEQQLATQEAERTTALAALRPVLPGKPGEITASSLRTLADALAAQKLSSAARAQLQEALERARASERERLADARRNAEQREPERKLDQLQRPPERQHARSVPEQLGRASDALKQHDDPRAAEALRAGAAQLEREQQQRAQLQQQRDELQHPEGDPQRRAQFERVARGGGSERDTGAHAPAERRIGGSYQDERVQGVHGEGPSRSQVIEGASQAGFASAPYRRVYGDYRAHAEQLMERDDVPANERFYVRRYFQLVQPREVR